MTLVGFCGNEPVNHWDAYGLLGCRFREVFTTRSQATADGHPVSPTRPSLGLTVPDISLKARFGTCSTSEHGEVWTFSCEVTVYYFISRNDPRLAGVRRHEAQHCAVAELTFRVDGALADVAMNGTCYCPSCFIAWREWTTAAVVWEAKKADADNTTFDCFQGDANACVSMGEKISESLAQGQEVAQRMRDVQRACP